MITITEKRISKMMKILDDPKVRIYGYRDLINDFKNENITVNSWRSIFDYLKKEKMITIREKTIGLRNVNAHYLDNKYKNQYNITLIIPLRHKEYAIEILNKVKNIKIEWCGKKLFPLTLSDNMLPSIESSREKKALKASYSSEEYQKEGNHQHFEKKSDKLLIEKNIKNNYIMPKRYEHAVRDVDIDDYKNLLIRVIPYIVIPDKKEDVYTILKRIKQFSGYFNEMTGRDPDPRKLADVFVEICQNYPEVFKLTNDEYMKDPQTTLIEIINNKYLHLLKLFPAGQWYYEFQLLGKGDFIFPNILIEKTIEEFNKYEKLIRDSLSKSNIYPELVILIAHSAIYPEWVFGKFRANKEIEKINNILAQEGYMLDKRENGIYGLVMIKQKTKEKEFKINLVDSYWIRVLEELQIEWIEKINKIQKRSLLSPFHSEIIAKIIQNLPKINGKSKTEAFIFLKKITNASDSTIKGYLYILRTINLIIIKHGKPILITKKGDSITKLSNQYKINEIKEIIMKRIIKNKSEKK